MKYRQEIIGAYKSGATVSELAELYKCTREAIYLRLRTDNEWVDMKVGKRVERTSKRLSELLMSSEAILEGWLAGVTMEDLAREFKTSTHIISKVIKQTFGSTNRNHKRDMEIVHRINTGSTQSKLAEEYGISQSGISRMVSALS